MAAGLAREVPLRLRGVRGAGRRARHPIRTCARLVSLETWDTPEQLYLARGDEVNPLRPLFTGDVFVDAAVPGVQDDGMAVVIAHPCSMRGREARLEPRVLTAAVTWSDKIGKSAWATGHYSLMPLPDLLEPGTLCVARLDDIGKALTEQLLAGTRIACLSPFGVNLLQQRIILSLIHISEPTRLGMISYAVFCLKKKKKKKKIKHNKNIYTKKKYK